MSWGDIAWGTFPEWFAAVGTVGAFGVALWLLFREEQARRAADEQRRRAQASQISAWIYGDTASGYNVKFRNASDLPVYDAGVSEPGGSAAIAGVLPPDVEIMLEMSVEEKPKLKVISGNPIDITLTFRDAQGQRWQRGPDGVLERF